MPTTPRPGSGPTPLRSGRPRHRRSSTAPRRPMGPPRSRASRRSARTHLLPGRTDCRSGGSNRAVHLLADAACRGGEVLVGGTPDDAVQLIDVRDLAQWIVYAAQTGLTGNFDGIGPSFTRGQFLAECAEAVGASCTFTWVDRAFLESHDIKRWSGPRSLPLWLPLPEFAGFNTRDTSAARDSGLTMRPLRRPPATRYIGRAPPAERLPVSRPMKRTPLSKHGTRAAPVSAGLEAARVRGLTILICASAIPLRVAAGRGLTQNHFPNPSHCNSLQVVVIDAHGGGARCPTRRRLAEAGATRQERIDFLKQSMAFTEGKRARLRHQGADIARGVRALRQSADGGRQRRLRGWRAPGAGDRALSSSSSRSWRISGCCGRWLCPRRN